MPGEQPVKFPQGAFEQTGTSRNAEPSACFECGICWQVYDPGAGDDYWQIAPGTPFAALPEHWRCPNCGAPRDKFLKLDGP